MLTEEQLTNAEANAKAIIEAKDNITTGWNNLVNGLRSYGYVVNPRTGKISKKK